MKRKAVIEKNIIMIKMFYEMTKKKNDIERKYWALGVFNTLSWMIDNSDPSTVSLSMCFPEEVQEIIENYNRIMLIE